MSKFHKFLYANISNFFDMIMQAVLGQEKKRKQTKKTKNKKKKKTCCVFLVKKVKQKKQFYLKLKYKTS